MEWDVVNEPMREGALREYLVRAEAAADADPSMAQSPADASADRAACGRLAGCRFVLRAFRAARAADPGATLVLNERRMEGRGCNPTDPVRPDDANFKTLVTALERRGLIDAVGLQMHCTSEGFSSPDRGARFGQLAARIESFTRLGVDVHLTELTVEYREPGRRSPAQEQEREQAAAYADIVDACARNPRCRSITLWHDVPPADRSNLQFPNAAVFRDDSGETADSHGAIVNALRCASVPRRALLDARAPGAACAPPPASCGGAGDVCCAAGSPCLEGLRCDAGRCAGSCSALCCDGSPQSASDTTSGPACAAAERSACLRRGGAVRVALNGVTVADGACSPPADGGCGGRGERCCEGGLCDGELRCDGARCVNRCLALCCDGTLQGPGDWADDATCRAMAAFACQGHGGVARATQNQRRILDQPCRCGGFPDLDASRGPAGVVCAGCLRERCCVQGMRCKANAQCGGLWACALQCLVDRGANNCGATCLARFAGGRADFDALLACRNDTCRDACSR